ncbi:MAG: hypothetical protein ACR2HR_02410 [Euzebya sp.]
MTISTTPDSSKRGIRSRLRLSWHDETGSQAMEYGALACGGVGITGLIVSLLNSEPVQSRLSNVLTGVLDQLGGVLSAFFG